MCDLKIDTPDHNTINQVYTDENESFIFCIKIKKVCDFNDD